MLLIDIGNTRIKWARIRAGVWTQQGVVQHAQWDELTLHFSRLSAPARIIVSNVCGAEMEQRLRSLCARWPADIELIVAQVEQCGVRNFYSVPERLGSDRWAALIGAWHLVRRGCLVINCGTATTVDTLSDAGEFLGGLILPGITLMQQSLLNNTTQLADVAGTLQDFPRNTGDAIYSGVVRATIGAIQYQYALLGSEEKAICVISGGAAEHIQAPLGLPLQRVEDLVLQGLQIIGEASA
ncbi:MAG: type III pantothenate kinase [Gallionellaceae bacterium]|jgi:type III pantothenate kinase